MPNRLPLDRLLVPVRQIGARVKTNLARYASPQAQTLLVACLANEADTFERLQVATDLARRGKLHELDLTLALRRGWPAPAATQ
jgi:hypothetical protein